MQTSDFTSKTVRPLQDDFDSFGNTSYLSIELLDGFLLKIGTASSPQSLYRRCKNYVYTSLNMLLHIDVESRAAVYRHSTLPQVYTNMAMLVTIRNAPRFPSHVWFKRLKIWCFVGSKGNHVAAC